MFTPSINSVNSVIIVKIIFISVLYKPLIKNNKVVQIINGILKCSPKKILKVKYVLKASNTFVNIKSKFLLIILVLL